MAWWLLVVSWVKNYFFPCGQRYFLAIFDSNISLLRLLQQVKTVEKLVFPNRLVKYENNGNRFASGAKRTSEVAGEIRTLRGMVRG